MKTLISVLLLSILCGLPALAQTRSLSPPKPFGPALIVEAGLCTDGGDTLLEAGERAWLLALVTNRGSVAAHEVQLVIQPEAKPLGIACTDRQELGTLEPGMRKEVVVEFVVGDSVPDQQVRTLLQASEGSGRSHPIDTVSFSTTASTLPSFRFAWHLEHPEAGILETAAPGDTVYLVLRVDNAGGPARGVSLHLGGYAGSLPLESADTLVVVGDLASGDSILHRVLVAIGPQADTVRAGVTIVEERHSLSRRWEIARALAGPAQLDLHRGTAAFQRNEIETALALYTEAVKKDPGLAQAHLLQGLVYEYLGDMKRCVPAIKRAAELGDSTALAWLENREQGSAPSVKYVRLKPDPFAQAGKGVGMAVLPSAHEGGSDLAERVYQKLAENGKARDRFTLYSATSLADQQEALGLTSLDPESEAVRTALRAVDIQYVLYGAVAGQSPLAITLRCVRTDDGTTLLDQTLRESRNSTALDDAVRLIAEGSKPVYQER